MDDKKKTYEHVGIDVEVEDRDSFASSAENGGVRGKNGLYFVCWSCVHVPNLSNRYFHSVVPPIFLHREETDLTALINNFRWLTNLREHESAMA